MGPETPIDATIPAIILFAALCGVVVHLLIGD